MPGRTFQYGYTGSLTTPPCSQGVAWFVLETAIKVGLEEIEAFKKLYDHNFRPVNPLNGRLLMLDESP